MSKSVDAPWAVLVAVVLLAATLVIPVTPVRADEDDAAPAAVPAGPPAPGATAGGGAGRPKESTEFRTEAEAQLATLEREAARLRDAGDAAKGEALEKRVRHFRDRLAGKAAAEAEGPEVAPELHVVGVYEGPLAGGARRGFREHPLGAASVDVGVTDRPVVLALCAYEPVKWAVNLADGAKIEKLILSGYYDQQAEGVPAGVPVEEYTHQGGAAARGQPFFAHARDLDHYPGLHRRLKELTGLDISTFQGAYSAPDGPFVVGPRNPEWLAQRVISEMRPLYLAAAAAERFAQQQAMRNVRFRGVLQSFPKDPRLPPEMARHRRVFSLAEFTIAGPVAGTLRTLPRDVTDVATDPRGPTHYGLTRDGVLQIDLDAQQVVQVAWDLAVGRLSWPMGIAFDTTRRRVVVATLGRGGLYAYSVEQKKWSVLADMTGAGADVASLTYVPGEDAFYALGMAHDSPARSVIHRFSGEGKPAGRVVLSRRIPSHPYDRPHGGPQVVAVGEYLAVLTPPVLDVDIDPIGPEEPRCYLFEPKTGRLVYSGPLRTQPPSREAPITAEELDDLWAALRDADDAAAEKLTWQMAAGGERAVEFLRGKLPPAAAPDAQRVDALVAKLSEAEAAARDEAAAELRQGGAAAKAELRRALDQDLAPETRARVGTVLAQIESDEEAARAEASGPPRPPADPAARHRWMVLMDAGMLRQPAPGTRWDDDPRLRRDRRGMIVLSRVGIPAAVDALRALAAGAPAAPRTLQAAAVLKNPEPPPAPAPEAAGRPRPPVP